MVVKGEVFLVGYRWSGMTGGMFTWVLMMGLVALL